MEHQDIPVGNWWTFAGSPQLNFRSSLRGHLMDNRGKIIPQVVGNSDGLVFSNPSIEQLCHQQDLDIFFLALPHGTAASYAIALLEAEKVIDLSADFRLNSADTYKEFYGEEHPDKELQTAQCRLQTCKTKLGKSKLIASPFATQAFSPLTPLEA